MLQEHGMQRPNVFEILQSVHRLRGTTSAFTYNTSPVHTTAARDIPLRPLPTNTLDSLVVVRPKSGQHVTGSPSQNAGTLAR